MKCTFFRYIKFNLYFLYIHQLPLEIFEQLNGATLSINILAVPIKLITYFLTLQKISSNSLVCHWSISLMSIRFGNILCKSTCHRRLPRDVYRSCTAFGRWIVCYRDRKWALEKILGASWFVKNTV
jgi:hypothetical protein